jgi:hypothetical protein
LNFVVRDRKVERMKEYDLWGAPKERPVNVASVPQ